MASPEPVGWQDPLAGQQGWDRQWPQRCRRTLCTSLGRRTTRDRDCKGFHPNYLTRLSNYFHFMGNETSSKRFKWMAQVIRGKPMFWLRSVWPCGEGMAPGIKRGVPQPMGSRKVSTASEVWYNLKTSVHPRVVFLARSLEGMRRRQPPYQ